MEHVAAELIAFIKANPGWATAVIALTAFGESFAFLSLLFPGTAILVAAGGLVSAGALSFVPTALAGIIGAVLGDSISFWLGQKFGPRLPGIWPFRKDPEMLERGMRFFQRFGGASVFIGRFFGPLRAVVPIAAGMMRMPKGRFYAANIISALIWAPALLSGGVLARWIFESRYRNAALIGLGVAAMLALGIVYWAKRRFRAE